MNNLFYISLVPNAINYIFVTIQKCFNCLYHFKNFIIICNKLIYNPCTLVNWKSKFQFQ